MQVLEAGARPRQQLDNIRATRTACEAELDGISSAGLSVDDAVQRLIASLGESRERAEAFARGFARPASAPDPLDARGVLAFVAWLDPKNFEAQLRKRLREVLPPPGLPLAQRSATIAKLKTKLRELDEAEERAICELEAQGFIVDRRADVDLEIVLKIWDAA